MFISYGGEPGLNWVVGIRWLGNAFDESWCVGGLGARRIGGAGRWDVCGNEGLDVFVLFKTTPKVATTVSGVRFYFSLRLPPTAAAHPEEDAQRDNDETSDTSHDTTDNGSDDRRRAGAYSKANLIFLGTARVPGLDDTRNDL